MIPNGSPFDFHFEQQRVEYLCRDQEWGSSEIHEGNDTFGLANIFKEYAGLPQEYPLHLTLEHGLKFDDNQSTIANKTIFKTILTPSRIRNPIIEREPGKRALPVGFGFLYAKALFQKFALKIIPENDRKGTIVFPFKSTPNTTVHFDHAAYATVLKFLPEKFQPVHVCLYWADIDKGLPLIYRDAKIPIVTAGHRYDPLFFHRFYDLCRRFRYAASNDIGTNLFLSVNSGCRFFYLDGPELRREVLPNRKVDDRVGNVFEQNRDESKRLFSSHVEEITPEQRNYVDTFLGVDCFLSPKHLRHLLLREQRLFENRPWWYNEKRLSAPPDAHNFTWNKFAPCQGWYFLESDADTIFRWMGRTDDAWVDLSYPWRFRKRKAAFSCRVHCMACEHIEINVNDQKIANLKRFNDRNGFRLEGTVSPETLATPLAKGVTRIGFHVSNAIRPSEHNPNNPETRRLGVAVSQISLQPES